METYVVGFKVFDGRCLTTEDGELCDPFVVVSCGEKSWQSVTKKDKMAFCPWNESCIWPAIDMYPREFESESIEFKVYATNWFTRNYLIGAASLQLSFVNLRRHHMYARRWLQLRTTESPEVTGKLMISVYVLRPGETPPSQTQLINPQEDDHDDADHEDMEDLTDLKTAVLGSTVDDGIVGKSSYVKLDIHRVDELRNLPGVFGAGSPSPYVTVEFAGALLSTDPAPSVNEFSFNVRMQIPVVTPLYEDTILIKLWTYNMFSADELLAQGLISFTELRNVGLEPRWFSLYGWDREEIPDLDAISATGVKVEPNYYVGRLLLSGRVERLDDDDDDGLQPATCGAAQTIAEPQAEQVVLFADVYMVSGVVGRRCRVEISYGVMKASTKWVDYSGQHPSDKTKMAQIERLQKDQSQEEDAFYAGDEENVSVFRFDEKNGESDFPGRIDPLVAIIPTDPRSQAKVMVSVYIEGFMGTEQRIGVNLFNLSKFPTFDYGRPPEPQFLSLNSMPNQASSQTQPSVLISLDKFNTDAVQRPQRKAFKPMIYLMRAYCFMARNIAWDGSAQSTTPEEFLLRVSCSGMSKTTAVAGPKPGPRPVWMEPVDLKLILLSHSTKEKPRMEPITVHLVRNNSLTTTDIGKAVCHYDEMRKQDNVGAWLEYELRPQWITIYGGQYNRMPMGEVLVAFEMMLWKNHDDLKLQPRGMWPYQPDVQPDSRDARPGRSGNDDDDESRTDGFCQLKKATLHFSLFGLRDLLPLPRSETMGTITGTVHVSDPLVEVKVEQFLPEPSPKCEFKFQKVIRNGDPRKKADQMKSWPSKIGHDGTIEAMNFEMLQVKTIKCLIPENALLESYLTVSVFEKPAYSTLDPRRYLGSGPTLIGESRISLAKAIPCCWLDDVDKKEPFKSQENSIRRQLKENEQKSAVQEVWVQNGIASADLAKSRKEGSVDNAATEQLVATEGEAEEFLDDSGLPKFLREDAPSAGKTLLLNALKLPNMQVEGTHSPRKGEPLHKVSSDHRDVVHGKLETDQPGKFPFQRIPLLRHHDIFTKRDREKDWDFQPGLVFGFVKCAFMLEDGWEDSDSDGEDSRPPQRTGTQENEWLKRSVDIDDEFFSTAFNEDRMQQTYKGEDGGARATLQIALVKAVCVFSKGSGSDAANPYMEINLGRRIHVSMRNMFKPNTMTPEFFRVESRQIELPEDGRLEVSVMDCESFLRSDGLIGSTVIDLEDRWFCGSPNRWEFRNETQVLTEKRPLYTAEYVDKVRGNLEMFVTMHDSSSEVKPIQLSKPEVVELEVRIVVWTCSKVATLPGYDHVNPTLKFTLDCKQHFGVEPKEQPTDVHYNPDEGNAVFNWRIVYRRIRMPADECTITVALYHHEALGPTLIGTLELDLKKHLDRVQKDGDLLETLPVDIPFEDTDMTTSADEDDIGTINMQMTIMTQGEANSSKVGLGREEPNVNPQLITPDGRGWDAYFSTFSFPWPDFGLWKKAIPFILAGLSFLFSMVVMKQLGLL